MVRYLNENPRFVPFSALLTLLRRISSECMKNTSRFIFLRDWKQKKRRGQGEVWLMETLSSVSLPFFSPFSPSPFPFSLVSVPFNDDYDRAKRDIFSLFNSPSSLAKASTTAFLFRPIFDRFFCISNKIDFYYNCKQI